MAGHPELPPPFSQHFAPLSKYRQTQGGFPLSADKNLPPILSLHANLVGIWFWIPPECQGHPPPPLNKKERTTKIPVAVQHLSSCCHPSSSPLAEEEYQDPGRFSPGCHGHPPSLPFTGEDYQEPSRCYHLSCHGYPPSLPLQERTTKSPVDDAS